LNGISFLVPFCYRFLGGLFILSAYIFCTFALFAFDISILIDNNYMNIALIGYGKMGKTIEQIAVSRGHKISVIIDENNRDDFNSDAFKNSDVAIEFTVPSSALNNYRKCFEADVPVVSGTTGWLEHFEDVKKECIEGNYTFFYASNYSLGVNIFFALNKYLAKIMNRFPDYDVKMEEIHHIHKLDAPSGTAITLAEDMISELERKNNWSLDAAAAGNIKIDCIREGEVPGIHEIIYDSEVDYISIKHDAKNRNGLALGAILAAEFAHDKKGFLGMGDMLKF
jgi:4-hydroxy-tetrahydrodipicolinate reductase